MNTRLTFNRPNPTAMVRQRSNQHRRLEQSGDADQKKQMNVLPAENATSSVSAGFIVSRCLILWTKRRHRAKIQRHTKSIPVAAPGEAAGKIITSGHDQVHNTVQALLVGAVLRAQVLPRADVRLAPFCALPNGTNPDPRLTSSCSRLTSSRAGKSARPKY